MLKKELVIQLRVNKDEKEKWKNFQEKIKLPSLSSLIRISTNAFITKELEKPTSKITKILGNSVWIRFYINSDLKDLWKSYASKTRFSSLSEFIRISVNIYIEEAIIYDKFLVSEDFIESIPIIIVPSLFSVGGLKTPSQRLKTEILLNSEKVENFKTFAVISGSSISLCSDTIIRDLDITPDTSKKIIVTNFLGEKIQSNPCRIGIIYRGLHSELTFYVIKNLENTIGTPILLGMNGINHFLYKESELLNFIKGLNKNIYIKHRPKLIELEKECEQNLKDIETFKHI